MSIMPFGRSHRASGLMPIDVARDPAREPGPDYQWSKASSLTAPRNSIFPMGVGGGAANGNEKLPWRDRIYLIGSALKDIDSGGDTFSQGYEQRMGNLQQGIGQARQRAAMRQFVAQNPQYQQVAALFSEDPASFMAYVAKVQSQQADKPKMFGFNMGEGVVARMGESGAPEFFNAPTNMRWKKQFAPPKNGKAIPAIPDGWELVE